MKLYAFDVDETLDISAGPIKRAQLIQLAQKHIVGLCGNWAAFLARVPNWTDYISFIGPMEMTKEAFLLQLKNYAPCEEVVMVGNIKGVSGRSDDEGAANRAGVRFIKESDFAEGVR